MKKIGKMFLVVLAAALINPFVADSTTLTDALLKADKAIAEVIGETGLKKGDPNLLVLTNAGYGTINGQSTEAFLDSAREKTGCSPGTRSLLVDPSGEHLRRTKTGHWKIPANEPRRP
jgi:formylmethanofuran dehydrogenase subunit E-like metal-binding protein